MSDEYGGNGFNIDRIGDDWAIWRYSGPFELSLDESSAERETLILTTEAMDELCNYFSEFYAEDRALSRGAH